MSKVYEHMIGIGEEAQFWCEQMKAISTEASKEERERMAKIAIRLARGYFLEEDDHDCKLDPEHGCDCSKCQ